METYNNNNNNHPRKLYRSNDSMIGGVCAGVAEYFNLDPTLIRVVAVIAFFMPMIPIVLIYIFTWLIVPANPNKNTY